MLLRPPCRSGRARPAFEVSFSLSVSDGLLVAPGMIDDADQEGKMFPFRDESHLLLTSDLQSDYLRGAICEFTSNFCTRSP